MARDGSQQNGRNLHGQTATPCVFGTLYIVGTPIGHPDDITLRALAVLQRVSIIASEDPRATQRLLAHHGMTATLTSYGPLNHQEKVPLLLQRLTQGQDVALVSDNGTPVIYDPGSQLVAAAHHAGIPVKTIPGPSAITAATAISGFSGDAILFDGQLPSTRPQLEKYLCSFRSERRTLAFYVHPGALTRLLKALAQILPMRQVAIALNLTTSQEALVRGRPKALLSAMARIPKHSTVTVVVAGDGAGTDRKRVRGNPPRATPLHGDK